MRPMIWNNPHLIVVVPNFLWPLTLLLARKMFATPALTFVNLPLRKKFLPNHRLLVTSTFQTLENDIALLMNH